MSVVTFLIGNGFDLACGLKSKYSDTYDGYIKSTSSSKAVKFFKERIGKNIDKWSDFEMAIAEQAKDFNNVEELDECITDYQNYLNNYLKQQQEIFHESCRNDENKKRIAIVAVLCLISDFFRNLKPTDRDDIFAILQNSENRIFKFINFNYTNIFDKLEEEAISLMWGKNSLMRDYFINKPIIHIHGRLDNDLVLGVDNKSQLVDLPYELDSRGQRTIIKPAFLEVYDKSRIVSAFSYIHSSDIICAFGLSFGESDLTWKEAVADWLLDNSKHHLVFFNDLAIKSYSNVAAKQKLNDEEDVKKDLIHRLWKEPMDEEKYNQVFQQIHIPAGVNIFEIAKDILKKIYEANK